VKAEGLFSLFEAQSVEAETQLTNRENDLPVVIGDVFGLNE